MTNPNNAVGTNAAYGGRTSVNAFNDDLTIYSRGILSGWACSPKSGMTVQIGGNGSDRDAAVAEDNAGNKTSINNISGSPIDVTIPAAPATNNRIDLIVAYADNPPSGTSTVVDNPAACGIIVVSGTAASNPTAPTNAAIRSAITADGASGSTAYYVILAQIRVGTGVTTIGSGVITQGDVVISNAQLADSSVTSDKIDWATLPSYVSHLTNNVTLSTSYTALNTLTIVEAGSYFVAGYAGFFRTASLESSDFQMQITGGDWTPYAIVTLPTEGGYPSVTAVGIITVSANTTVTLQARFTNSGGAFAGRAEYLHSLSAFRVA